MADNADSNNQLDIGRQQLGGIYARALLATSQSSGNVAGILDELDSLVHDVLDKLPGLDRTLASSRVDYADKVRILDSAFASRMSSELLTFLKVVATRSRLDCLREILKAARHQYNQQLGRVAVQLTTAVSVEKSLRNQLANTLRDMLGSEVDIDHRTDAGLIGGILVRIEDTLYDASVANRLKQLRSDTLHKTFQDMLGKADQYVE